MESIADKVACITGGDSGIGLGIAQALIRAGARIAITYRSDAHLKEAMTALATHKDRVHAIKADVADRTAMIAAAAETVQVFGKVHILINNAGVAPLVPLNSATFEDFDWCMNVNVQGVFNGIRAFLPHIRAHNEGGHIVATASMLGGVVVGPFWGVYSTSKFAVVGMMEALRSELLGSNIGVSVFCPGGVKSNIGSSKRNRPAELAASGISDPQVMALMEPFATAFAKIKAEDPDGSALMEPVQAGEIVLAGIRNNDLYILSHPEYEAVIRERSDALLASLPTQSPPPSASRLAMARLAHTPIYSNEIKRRKA